MSTHQEKFIDLEKVIRSKSQTLANMLPGFVLRWLKKIIHEDEINNFIEHNGHLHDHEFVRACFDVLGAKTETFGLENIPKTGGCIIAANHPLGGLDGLALMKVVGAHRPDIRFFVNDILLNMQNFGSIFVGVNKHGKNPRENLRLMDETFASDHCVLYFPAGLVSRKQGGLIRDLEWQKSYIARAVQYQKPIIPTFIGGENSNFFYTLAQWRKRIGIKANIEMLFLVDEMFKQKNKTLKFVFGNPVLPQNLTKDITHQEWANRMKEQVYALGNSH